MFFSRSTLDIIVMTKDGAFKTATEAMHEAYSLSLGAKEVEVGALKRQIADLSEQLRYERSRADNLVDRLLVRDAKVAAVAPAAIEAAKLKDEIAVKRLKEVFDQVNSVGADPPLPVEARAFELAGGKVVGRV